MWINNSTTTIKIISTFLTMFTVMLGSVVGYTDCHFSNSERTTQQISIKIINQEPLHGIDALAMPCIEPYDADFCLNGGRCFNVTIGSYSIPSCECAIGFMGERCEQKYLIRSYNQENYMQADESIISQNKSEVDKHRTVQSRNDVFVTKNHIGSSAINKVSATQYLLVVMTLLHFLRFIVAL